MGLLKWVSSFFCGFYFLFSTAVSAQETFGAKELYETIFQEIGRQFPDIDRTHFFRVYEIHSPSQPLSFLGVVAKADLNFPDLSPAVLVRNDGQVSAVMVNLNQRAVPESVYSLQYLKIEFKQAVGSLVSARANLEGAGAGSLEWTFSEDRTSLELRSHSAKQILAALRYFSRIPAVANFTLSPSDMQFEIGDSIDNEGDLELHTYGIKNRKNFLDRLPKIDPLFDLRRSSDCVDATLIDYQGRIGFRTHHRAFLIISNAERVKNMVGIPMRYWLNGRFRGQYPEEVEVVAVQALDEFSAEFNQNDQEAYFISPHGVKYILPSEYETADLIPGNAYSFKVVGGLRLGNAKVGPILESVDEVPELVGTSGVKSVSVFGPITGKSWVRVAVREEKFSSNRLYLSGEGHRVANGSFRLTLNTESSPGKSTERTGVLVVGETSRVTIPAPDGNVEIDTSLSAPENFLNGKTRRDVCRTVLLSLR